MPGVLVIPDVVDRKIVKQHVIAFLKSLKLICSQLFFQLSCSRLPGRFSRFDSSLRELPGMIFPGLMDEQKLSITLAKNDQRNIRSVHSKAHKIGLVRIDLQR